MQAHQMCLVATITIAVIVGSVISVAPSIAKADACSDYRLAQMNYDALITHKTKLLGDQPMTETKMKELSEVTVLWGRAIARLKHAGDAVRATLDSNSNAAIIIDALSELESLNSKAISSSREWDLSSPPGHPTFQLVIKTAAIAVAIDEARDEAFNALCQ